MAICRSDWCAARLVTKEDRGIAGLPVKTELPVEVSTTGQTWLTRERTVSIRQGCGLRLHPIPEES